ncbi:MAG: hypothetical protein Q4D24_07235 [Erysipelotrichaceae bacterium]|nr:hypothetical protein [Erysipelotrichaceae bacterium]
MKKIYQTTGAVIGVLSLMLAGCSGNTAPETNTETPQSEMSNAEISEKAMDNFLAKLSEGNYTMDAPEFLKTLVHSKELITFDYQDDLHEDFVVMSVNNETFQGYPEGDKLNEVSFLGEGDALTAAENRLPNQWAGAMSDGNIYNLFYNQQDEPLTFVSYEDSVKDTMKSFVGYSDNAVRLMHEVYLVMDDVDPKTVHLKAEVDEDMVARVNYDDIDITLTFGESEGNAAAEAWMKAPVYPEARTDWDEMDEFILNSVFLPPYGRDAVPFPRYAGYAFTNDQESFFNEEVVRTRDSHATEKDMADYIQLLLDEGFTEATYTDEDGKERTCYRRILREDYNCYSQVEVSYDDGVNMTAEKYYDVPVYEGLEAVNNVIVPKGFTALPESDNFTNVSAKDIADETTESWMYFFHYDNVLYVDMDFNDKAEAEAYLKAYQESLGTNGFHPTAADEEDPERYESEEGHNSFRYQFADDDTVTLLYKAEHYISAEEAETMIKDAGFPAVDLNTPITARDLRSFYKTRNNLDYKLYLAISQEYATAQEAEDFLGKYEDLLSEQGFGRVSPDSVGSLKQIAIYNEDTGMLVGVDFFEQNGGALVNFDFEAE